MASMLPITLPKHGGVFLDVGANLGYYSVLFASRGWRVVAVEPMARNRAALRASLCLNPHLTASVSLHSRALVSPSQSGLRCVARSDPRFCASQRCAAPRRITQLTPRCVTSQNATSRCTTP